MYAASSILYVRLPGLLVQAGRVNTGPRSAPLANIKNGLVRDACLRAVTSGVRGGEPVNRAGHQCPMLLTIPVEDIDALVSLMPKLRGSSEEKPYP